jgi:hypothetical protein
MHLNGHPAFRRIERRSRRDTLRFGLLILFWNVAGCGGGSSAGRLPDGTTTAAPPIWSVPPIGLGQGAASTYDLASTLPDEIARGGVFAVDPSGSSLPTGVTLNAAGILSAVPQVTETISGVIFSYTPMAG